MTRQQRRGSSCTEGGSCSSTSGYLLLEEWHLPQLPACNLRQLVQMALRLWQLVLSTAALFAVAGCDAYSLAARNCCLRQRLPQRRSRHRQQQQQQQQQQLVLRRWRHVPAAEIYARFQHSWQLLSYRGECCRSARVQEWRVMTDCRIADVRADWLAARQLLMSRAGGQQQQQQQQQLHAQSLQLHARVLRDTWPQMLECRRILNERRLPEGFQLQGSARDFWGFQEASDLDVAKCWQRQAALRVCNVAPGHCQLRRPARVEGIADRRGWRWLFGRRLPADSLVTSVFSPGRFRRRVSSWRLANCDRRSGSGCLQEHGPAVTQHCSFGDNDSRDVDFVCTVRLAKWPRFLMSEFLPRHCRKFPISSASAKIHVVPIGEYSCGRQFRRSHTWRYSYHELEAALVSSFTPAEGACYAVAKLLHRRFLKPAGYKSYHVKTSLLWLRHFERTEDWEAEILHRAAAAVLLLQQCAGRGFMPNYFMPNYFMPNYFMPNENVMRQPPRPASVVHVGEMLEFLSRFADSQLPLVAMTPGRLRQYLRQLGDEIADCGAELSAASDDGCFCRVDIPTGVSLEADCHDCDRLLHFDISQQQQQQQQQQQEAAPASQFASLLAALRQLTHAV